MIEFYTADDLKQDYTVSHMNLHIFINIWISYFPSIVL